MIEMHVERRKDKVKMVVLHRRQAVRKLAHMMIIDEGQRAHDRAIRFLRGLLDECVANQVAERFGAVGVSPLLNMFVEFGEKVGIDGHADAAKIAH